MCLTDTLTVTQLCMKWNILCPWDLSNYKFSFSLQEYEISKLYPHLIIAYTHL